MFNIKLLFFVLFCFVTMNNWAQKKRTFYVDKITELCPDNIVYEYEVKDNFIEIEYDCGGDLIETILDKRGNFIYSEEPYNLGNAVLAKIEKKLSKKYSNWIIDECSMVTTPDTSFIKFELILNGIEENLYFTKSGKYFRLKNIQMSEGWNGKNLRSNTYYSKARYDFTKPTTTWELPGVLREISGMNIVGDSVMYCIQDELGIVFEYDLLENNVMNTFRFTDIGDFEDIALMGDTIVVLRSDGALFRFNYKNFNGEFIQTHPQFSCLNLEGLFFNEESDRLLAVCKDGPIQKTEEERYIYQLSSNKLNDPEYFMSIQMAEVNAFIAKNYGEIISKAVTVNPSAIAIHPITNDIYVLSATNRILLVYDEEKQLKDVYPLTSEVYYKPEGIVFNEQGNMYISSEGIKNGKFGSEVYYLKQK